MAHASFVLHLFYLYGEAEAGTDTECSVQAGAPVRNARGKASVLGVYARTDTNVSAKADAGAGGLSRDCGAGDACPSLLMHVPGVPDTPVGGDSGQGRFETCNALCSLKWRIAPIRCI